MDKQEIIFSGMKNIYDFANDFQESEAIGILVGVLVTYCKSHKLNPELIIQTFKFSYDVSL